jgi:hypothetical protein
MVAVHVEASNNINRQEPRESQAKDREDSREVRLRIL